jgi:hypothetical protein
VFEPELVPYFLAPTLALMAVSASRAPWWRLLATGALAVWLNWWLHFAVDERWSAWLILIAQLALLAWLGRPSPGARPDADHAVATTDPDQRPDREPDQKPGPKPVPKAGRKPGQKPDRKPVASRR